jgi:hypothetical protein
MALRTVSFDITNTGNTTLNLTINARVSTVFDQPAGGCDFDTGTATQTACCAMTPNLLATCTDNAALSTQITNLAPGQTSPATITFDDENLLFQDGSTNCFQANNVTQAFVSIFVFDDASGQCLAASMQEFTPTQPTIAATIDSITVTSLGGSQWDINVDITNTGTQDTTFYADIWVTPENTITGTGCDITPTSIPNINLGTPTATITSGGSGSTGLSFDDAILGLSPGNYIVYVKLYSDATLTNCLDGGISNVFTVTAIISASITSLTIT